MDFLQELFSSTFTAEVKEILQTYKIEKFAITVDG